MLSEKFRSCFAGVCYSDWQKKKKKNTHIQSPSLKSCCSLHWPTRYDPDSLAWPTQEPLYQSGYVSIRNSPPNLHFLIQPMILSRSHFISIPGRWGCVHHGKTGTQADGTSTSYYIASLYSVGKGMWQIAHGISKASTQQWQKLLLLTMHWQSKSCGWLCLASKRYSLHVSRKKKNGNI